MAAISVYVKGTVEAKIWVFPGSLRELESEVECGFVPGHPEVLGDMLEPTEARMATCAATLDLDTGVLTVDGESTAAPAGFAWPDGLLDRLHAGELDRASLSSIEGVESTALGRVLRAWLDDEAAGDRMRRERRYELVGDDDGLDMEWMGPFVASIRVRNDDGVASLPGVLAMPATALLRTLSGRPTISGEGLPGGLRRLDIPVSTPPAEVLAMCPYLEVASFVSAGPVVSDRLTTLRVNVLGDVRCPALKALDIPSTAVGDLNGLADRLEHLVVRCDDLRMDWKALPPARRLHTLVCNALVDDTGAERLCDRARYPALQTAMELLADSGKVRARLIERFPFPPKDDPLYGERVFHPIVDRWPDPLGDEVDARLRAMGAAGRRHVVAELGSLPIDLPPELAHERHLVQTALAGLARDPGEREWVDGTLRVARAFARFRSASAGHWGSIDPAVRRAQLDLCDEVSR